MPKKPQLDNGNSSNSNFVLMTANAYSLLSVCRCDGMHNGMNSGGAVHVAVAVPAVPAPAVVAPGAPNANRTPAAQG